MKKQTKNRSGYDPEEWRRQEQAKYDTQLVAIIAGHIYARRGEPGPPLDGEIDQCVAAAGQILAKARTYTAAVRVSNG